MKYLGTIATRVLALTLAAFLVVVCLNLAVQFASSMLIKKWLSFDVTAQFRPDLFQPEFDWMDVRGSWRGKAQIYSGNIRVKLDMVSMLAARGLRIRIMSNNLTVRFDETWISEYGMGELNLQQLDADIEIGDSGIREIYGFVARSPQFEFNLSPQEA